LDIDAVFKKSRKLAWLLDDDFYYANFIFHMRFDVPVVEWRHLFKSFGFTRYLSFLFFGRSVKFYNFSVKLYVTFFQVLWDLHRVLIMQIIEDRFDYHIGFPFVKKRAFYRAVRAVVLDVFSQIFF